MALPLAIDLGYQLSIDGAAHAPGQLDFQVGCARRGVGMDPHRIVETWPRERLLEGATP